MDYWKEMPEDIADEMDKQAYMFLAAEGYNTEKCATSKKERDRLYNEIKAKGEVLKRCSCFNAARNFTTIWVELYKADGTISRSRGVNIKVNDKG